MDPISLLVAINLFVTITANFSGAKKGLKTSVTKAEKKPKSFLQKVPPNVSAVVLVLIVLGIFKIGTIEDSSGEYLVYRIVGLVIFLLFSWGQIWSYKALGKNYAQEIVIMKDHELSQKGPYRLIRHPQYLCQFISDLGAGIALMSFLVVPAVVFIEIPLLFMRASLEEKILEEHFEDEYSSYREKSGFFIPFIG